METVRRALQLLKCIAEKPLRMMEVAELMGINKSSASRMLNTLHQEGFVELNSSRKYEIGSTIYLLSKSASESNRIRRLASPHLTQLAEDTGETIHLAALDGNNVIYIDKIDSNKAVRLNSRIGTSNPIHCTGVAKVLLAYSPSRTSERIISKVSFDKYTDNTIANEKQFRKELDKVRKSGVAYVFEEHFESVNCIAAPVFDNRGVAAGISISSTTVCTDRETLIGYRDQLIETANQISLSLGYRGKMPVHEKLHNF
ncbi:MAG: IclR family transcriptional regulator [Christensenellales bacterium]|jgi:DNA-binding IclR family transcriptional regulator